MKVRGKMAWMILPKGRRIQKEVTKLSETNKDIKKKILIRQDLYFFPSYLYVFKLLIKLFAIRSPPMQLGSIGFA